MKISSRIAPPESIDTPLLAMPWAQATKEGRGKAEEVSGDLEGLDRAVGGGLSRAIGSRDFVGKKGDTFMLYRQSDAGPERILLVGLGPRDDLMTERFREAGGHVAKTARNLALGSMAVLVSRLEQPEPAQAARALGEGIVLGAWRFRELRSEEGDDAPELEELLLVGLEDGMETELSSGGERGRILARAQNYARELAVRPGNIATPSYLAEQASDLAKHADLNVTVLGPKELEKEGMGALLGVAMGSDEEPRLIIMEYRGAGDAKPVVLVGKGVTFDSGGLSLKPPSGMETMKYDMSGAAAVMGAMKAIGEIRPRMNVVGIVPSVENLPSAHAMRPGDVIKSHSGKTIEVLNTDAEGRLILADALSYAARYEPQAMVDAATLTGACVVALGHQAMGLMGNDDEVIEALKAAAGRCGERVWQLPLWSEYRDQLKSEIADIKNTGGRPAGTITAGKFLEEFVGSTAWAHLDIAGMAWADDAGPYQPKGPTGVGVRLLTEWVTGQAG